MRVEELRKEIYDWVKERQDDKPSMIAIDQKTFHLLMSNKDSREHIELLFDREGYLIGHQFYGIPLPITNEVEGIKIMSDKDVKQHILNQGIHH